MIWLVNQTTICIFLASLSSTKKHSRSKSSTLPVSGRKKPSTLNIHHSVNNDTLISSSLTPSKKNSDQILSANNKQANSNIATARKAPNKTIENKNIQNKQLKLNLRPTNFNGQLLTENLPNGQQRNSKKKALESK